MKAFFFGCWNCAGHFMFVPGGRSAYSAGFKEEDRKLSYVFSGHVDGGLAPKWIRDSISSITFEAKWPRDSDERRRIQYRYAEMAQGLYLIHHANGYTYMSWWDRTQGDTRGACNSNFILEDTHDASKMESELARLFPHVVENLREAEILLRQVVLP